MRKISLFVLIFGLFMFNTTFVSAACDMNETTKLNNLATNVKVSYELIEKEFAEGEYTPSDGSTEEEEELPATYYVFRVYIENITKDLYVEVHEDLGNTTTKYTYDDAKDGTITIDWYNTRAITNFTFNVYSSNNTNCANTKLTTNFLTTPRYNEYREYDLCKGNEDFYLCYEWLTVGNVEFDKFVTLIGEYEAGKINEEGEEVKEKEEKGIFNFIKNNKGIVIGVTIGVIAIGGLVTVVLVKKKRGKIV